MKAWWTLQASRIDALSLRERVFLFLALIACCFALANVLWFAPAQSAHRELRQRVVNQTQELGRLREELKASATQPAAGLQARDELEQLKQRNAALAQEVAAAVGSVSGTAPLEQVLVQLLRRHEGLTLVQAVTLAPDAPTARPGAGAVLAGLKRQGLELTVAGPYADLVRYVQTLERALPALRWGSLKLASDKQPPQLTLQVSVIAAQP